MDTGMADSAAPTAPAPPTRHPLYYFPECDVVFLVSNILYRLPSSYLSLDSGIIRAMLSLPVVGTQQGSSDENPVLVQNLTSKEFDHFLDYQLRHILPQGDGEALTAILKVAHFLQYEEAQAMAKTALDELPKFDPVMKLTLGLRIGLPDWVTTAFKQLALAASERVLTLEESEQLGFGPYRALMETRWAIVMHRRRLAYTFPEIVHHAPDCKDNFDCDWGWKMEWKSKVALYLIQPETPVLGAQILSLLETTQMRDVHPSCRVKMVNAIRRSAILAQEDTLMAEALATLVPSS